VLWLQNVTVVLSSGKEEIDHDGGWLARAIEVKNKML